MRPIEIKCNKAQFKRITEAMEFNVQCPFGKSEYSCPSIKDHSWTCKKCINKNVRRVEP